MNRPTTIVFLILILFLSFAVLPISAPDPIRHWLDLELANLYGFRGDQINLTAYSSYSEVNVQIYDPIDSLIYNQTWSGNESRLLPIQQNALLGEYTLIGRIPDFSSNTWFNVVDSSGFEPVYFPFLRIHNNAEYWVFANRSLRVNYGAKSFGFSLPEMPQVSINCFNNSDIFVARFSSAIVNIDLSLVFVHAGAKLVLNGTMQNGFSSFSFRFYSPQQIRRWANRINFRSPNIIGNDPSPLYFDWSDFVRAGEHLSYNQSSGVLTVFDVPETFHLDPVIGNNVVESGSEGYENYDEGNRHQVLNGDGNITSMSIYCRVTSGSDDIGVAIYDDDSTDPDNLLFNASRTISHTSFRWENFTVSPQVSVTNASYLHLMHNKEALVEVRQNATEGEADPNSVYDFRTYAMPFLDPFPPTHNDHAYMFSIYCDYTLDAAPTTINQYSTVNQTSSISSAGMSWLFSRFSGVSALANVSSSLSWSFSIYGSAALSFAINSIVTSGVFQNFYSSIGQVFGVTSSSSWSFSLFHSIAQTLAVNGIAIFSQPLHNFFGSIGQVFAVVGYTDLTPSVYATRGFVLATIILAFIVVGIPLTLVIAKK